MYVSFCLEVILDLINKHIALHFQGYGQTFFAKKLIF